MDSRISSRSRCSTRSSVRCHPVACVIVLIVVPAADNKDDGKWKNIRLASAAVSVQVGFKDTKKVRFLAAAVAAAVCCRILVQLQYSNTRYM